MNNNIEVDKYLKSTKIKRILIIVFVIFLLLSFSLDISIGAGNYPLKDVLATILDKTSISIEMEVVVWDLRLPIALMAILVGVMLSLSGAQMQTILNNPLADPFTLGISSAASFGAALAIILGRGFPVPLEYLVPVNAFVFAFSTSLVLYFFTKLKGVNVETMVLVGIALMFLFSAFVSILQYQSDETSLQQLVFWMMGSLGKSSWDKILICCILLSISFPYFIAKVWSMTALRLGDDKARSMGVNIERLRLIMLLFISILASVSVAFVGVVGFIGLVAPHIARMLVGEDQRFFLLMSGLCGALLMSITSIVSKSIIDGVIFPIGIITSLIGIPFFVSLILASRKRSW